MWPATCNPTRTQQRFSISRFAGDYRLMCDTQLMVSQLTGSPSYHMVSQRIWHMYRSFLEAAMSANILLQTSFADDSRCLLLICLMSNTPHYSHGFSNFVICFLTIYRKTSMRAFQFGICQNYSTSSNVHNIILLKNIMLHSFLTDT